jgi:arylsulfatase A-like enzyme
VVNTVDMFPTVADALALEIPDGLAGESLLTRGASADRLVVSESYPEVSIRRIHPRFDHVERAMIFGDMKFVASTSGEMHLFDLRRDAGESRDLYPAQPNLLNFPVRLANWLDTHEAVEGSPVTLDASTLQNLKALGYIH